MIVNTLYKKKILRECIDFDVNPNKTKLAVIQLKDLDNSLYYMVNVFNINERLLVESKDIEDPDIIFLKCPLVIRFAKSSAELSVLTSEFEIKIYSFNGAILGLN